MKINLTIKPLFYVTASILMLVGCTKETDDTQGRSDGKLRVSFSAPTIEQNSATPTQRNTTRAAAALTEKTTVRVVVLTKDKAVYSADQAFFVDSNGKLKPCTVNLDGSFKAVDMENELALYKGNYDFYAYTPAVPLGADKKSVTVPNGIDYASSVTPNISVTADKTQTLTTLDRKCSRIALVVKKGNGSEIITAISVGAGGVTIKNLPATVAGLGLNEPIAQASGSTTLNVAQAAFKNTSAIETSAITYLLPRLGTDRINLSFNLTYTVSGNSDTKDLNGSMGNITLESGKSYTFTLTLLTNGASLSVTDWIDGGTQDLVAGAFDYSIDGSSGFLLASGDAKNPDPLASDPTKMNWHIATGIYNATNNPNTLKACPDGWRVPTINELQLLWVYNSAIPVEFSLSERYWSATEEIGTMISIMRYHVNFVNGLISSITGDRKDAFKVRCIRSLTI